MCSRCMYVCMKVYLYVCTLITYLNRCLLEYEVAILQQLLQQHHVWPSLQMLTKYLHLNDNTKMPDRSSPEYDRLYKIRPLLVSSFKSAHQWIFQWMRALLVSREAFNICQRNPLNGVWRWLILAMATCQISTYSTLLLKLTQERMLMLMSTEGCLTGQSLI